MASPIVKFRCKEELFDALQSVHGELGKGDLSDSVRYLLALGIDTHRERYAWLKQVKEEARKRGLMIKEV